MALLQKKTVTRFLISLAVCSNQCSRLCLSTPVCSLTFRCLFKKMKKGREKKRSFFLKVSLIKNETLSMMINGEYYLFFFHFCGHSYFLFCFLIFFYNHFSFSPDYPDLPLITVCGWQLLISVPHLPHSTLPEKHLADIGL